MLLINKTIITENNTLISVGSFSRKESTELKGIVIFQKDNSRYNFIIEDIKIIYDVIEYKPNVILTLASDGNGNCCIQIFDVSSATYSVDDDIDYKSGDYLSATLNIHRINSILPILKAEYQFAKTVDGAVILYYNLKSPNCKTKAIIISLKDDLIYHSVTIVDQIIHSDNAINEYRPNQIWDFNLNELIPLKNRIRSSTDAIPISPDNKTILILKFKPQHAELSSHDIITIDEYDVVVDYQVCYNKLIIICRNEFEGELISKIYICNYQISADRFILIQDGPMKKINLTISNNIMEN